MTGLGIHFKHSRGLVCVLSTQAPQKIMKIGYIINDRIYTTWSSAYEHRSTSIEAPHQCLTLQDYVEEDLVELDKSFHYYLK